MKKQDIKFFIIKWLITLTVIYTGWVGIMFSMQEKFIFQSSKEIIEHPMAKTLVWEDVEFKTDRSGN